MPISLRPDRGDVPQLGDPAYDALLAGALRPEEAAASLRPIVESFAALYAAPVHSDPAAEASAMHTFRALAATWPDGGWPSAGWPGAGRRVGSRPARLSLGVAAVVVVLATGGAAAAYTGDLPAPMQQAAHVVIGAPPAVRGTPRPALTHPAVPPIPASAAYGLCRAYGRALAHGDAAHTPVPFRRLAAAAGGASQVRAYCARVIHPGNPAAGHLAHPPHGKPSAPPTPATPPTHHGKPSWAASPPGKPTK